MPNIYNAANTLENDQQFEFESLTKYSPNYYQLFGEHYRAIQGLGFNYKHGKWNVGLTGLYSFGSVGMETLPLVLTTNYSFDLKKVKLTIGSNIKQNFRRDNSKYFDLAVGADFHNNKVSFHLSNALVFNPRNFDHTLMYEDSLYSPFLVLSYQHQFFKKGWAFTPELRLMANDVFNYSVISFLAKHEKINVQVFASSKKEWSHLLGKDLNQLSFKLGYERKLEWHTPSIEGGHLENKHYVTLMIGYSI
ncbi:MAG: hypothetical protein ACPGLV_07100 [Bacteroidia bacterium]